MTDKIHTGNKFEQNKSSKVFEDFVAKQLSRLDESERTHIERTKNYPATYDEYADLSIEDRLKAAKRILIYEAPRIGRGGREMPQNALRFDISDLADTSADSVEAIMAYAEGQWTNALNDTYISEHDHIKIHVKTTKDGFSTTSKFAYVMFNGYRSDVYSVSDSAENTDDPNHPLFIDAMRIVDLGIAELYCSKLAARVQKLAEIALQEVR